MPARATPKQKGKFIAPMDKHVGQQIKIARLARGWSQTKLAAVLDLSFQQVQKYEKGGNRVSGARLSQIASALNLSGVEVFFKGGPGYGNGADKPEPALYEMLATRDGFRMGKLWQRLSPKQRHAVLDLTEAVFSP